MLQLLSFAGLGDPLVPLFSITTRLILFCCWEIHLNLDLLIDFGSHLHFSRCAHLHLSEGQTLPTHGSNFMKAQQLHQKFGHIRPK